MISTVLLKKRKFISFVINISCNSKKQRSPYLLLALVFTIMFNVEVIFH